MEKKKNLNLYIGPKVEVGYLFQGLLLGRCFSNPMEYLGSVIPTKHTMKLGFVEVMLRGKSTGKTLSL